MTEDMQLLVFCVGDQRHALPLDVVARVTPAAQVTPLPGAPAAVLGAIDVGGRILPVFSMRIRLGLQPRAIRPSDVFLIARAGHRFVALLVEEVQAVRSVSAPTIDATVLTAGLETLRELVRLDDGLLLIHDLDWFLSAESERALDAGMRRVQ